MDIDDRRARVLAGNTADVVITDTAKDTTPLDTGSPIVPQGRFVHFPPPNRAERRAMAKKRRSAKYQKEQIRKLAMKARANGMTQND